MLPLLRAARCDAREHRERPSFGFGKVDKDSEAALKRLSFVPWSNGVCHMRCTLDVRSLPTEDEAKASLRAVALAPQVTHGAGSSSEAGASSLLPPSAFRSLESAPMPAPTGEERRQMAAEQARIGVDAPPAMEVEEPAAKAPPAKATAKRKCAANGCAKKRAKKQEEPVDEQHVEQEPATEEEPMDWVRWVQCNTCKEWRDYGKRKVFVSTDEDKPWHCGDAPDCHRRRSWICPSIMAQEVKCKSCKVVRDIRTLQLPLMTIPQDWYCSNDRCTDLAIEQKWTCETLLQQWVRCDTCNTWRDFRRAPMQLTSLPETWHCRDAPEDWPERRTWPCPTLEPWCKMCVDKNSHGEWPLGAMVAKAYLDASADRPLCETCTAIVDKKEFCPVRARARARLWPRLAQSAWCSPHWRVRLCAAWRGVADLQPRVEILLRRRPGRGTRRHATVQHVRDVGAFQVRRHRQGLQLAADVVLVSRLPVRAHGSTRFPPHRARPAAYLPRGPLLS